MKNLMKTTSMQFYALPYKKHFLNVNLKLYSPPQLKQSSVDNLGKLSSTFFSRRMTFKRKLILVVLLEKPPEVFL